MQVKHLDHINLSVASFAKTAQWYERVFGFYVVEQGLREGCP
ncbi:MAG: VOC family protein [Planctomycetes bacterium]|nr:VOC family protein [Planctomycetota bacterium]